MWASEILRIIHSRVLSSGVGLEVLVFLEQNTDLASEIRLDRDESPLQPCPDSISTLNLILSPGGNGVGAGLQRRREYLAAGGENIYTVPWRVWVFTIGHELIVD